MDNQQSQLNLNVVTWPQFYEQYKPEGLMIQFHKVSRIFDSIKRQRITLWHIHDTFGEYEHKKYGKSDCGIIYIYEWLSYLNILSNINKPMPPESMKHTALILYLKYYFFYLSDLKLILEWILERKYGTFYGSVDAQLIITAFKEYNEERKKMAKEKFPEQYRYIYK